MIRINVNEVDRRTIKDGIYDVTDITFLITKRELQYNNKKIDSKNYEEWYETDDEDDEAVQSFINQYPNYVIASAYETSAYIFLAKSPDKFNGKRYGSGFHYGSTNILQNCPKDILILAEND